MGWSFALFTMARLHTAEPLVANSPVPLVPEPPRSRVTVGLLLPNGAVAPFDRVPPGVFEDPPTIRFGSSDGVHRHDLVWRGGHVHIDNLLYRGHHPVPLIWIDLGMSARASTGIAP